MIVKIKEIRNVRFKNVNYKKEDNLNFFNIRYNLCRISDQMDEICNKCNLKCEIENCKSLVTITNEKLKELMLENRLS